MTRTIHRRCLEPWLGLALLLAVGTLACTPAAFFNITTTLGGEVPGKRSNISVAFINNTPYRAVFTFGTYDPQNTAQNLPISFPIKFQQFFVDPDGVDRLDGFSQSNVITFTASPGVANDPGGCGRAISIGGERLITLIEENRRALEEAGNTIHDEALRPVCDPSTNQPQAGIAFFSETSPGPQINACDSASELAAWADPVITLQGAQYQCDSLLLYTFEVDNSQPGGVRVDLTVILP